MPLDIIDYLPINNNLLVVVDSRLLFEPDHFKKRQSFGLFHVVATPLPGDRGLDQWHFNWTFSP